MHGYDVTLQCAILRKHHLVHVIILHHWIRDICYVDKTCKSYYIYIHSTKEAISILKLIGREKKSFKKITKKAKFIKTAKQQKIKFCWKKYEVKNFNKTEISNQFRTTKQNMSWF